MHCEAPLCNTIVLHYCVAQRMFNCVALYLTQLNYKYAIVLDYGGGRQFFCTYMFKCVALYMCNCVGCWTIFNTIALYTCNCVRLCTCIQLCWTLNIYVQLCWTMEAGRQLGESCCRCKCLQSSATSSAIECIAIMQHC